MCPMETTFFRSLPKKLFFASLCSFSYMSAGCVSTFRTCVQGYLEWLPFVFCFLPSFHAFVIDFLSIRKVILFSAIANDDRHPRRSRSIHQNAANCKTIRFRYIAQPRGGYGKPTAHAHVMMFDALPVGRTACRVRR